MVPLAPNSASKQKSVSLGSVSLSFARFAFELKRQPEVRKSAYVLCVGQLVDGLDNEPITVGLKQRSANAVANEVVRVPPTQPAPSRLARCLGHVGPQLLFYREHSSRPRKFFVLVICNCMRRLYHRSRHKQDANRSVSYSNLTTQYAVLPQEGSVTTLLVTLGFICL